MHPKSAALALALLGAAGCGDVVSANVEVPRICITQPAIAIPGEPVAVTVSSPQFALDLGSQVPLLRTNATGTDLRVDEVDIIPVSGNPDLSGITAAALSAFPASGAPVEVVHYTRNAAAPAPTSLVLDGGTVNVAPYLVSGQAQLQITLSGQPPRTSWTADVKTCMHGQSTVSP